MRQPAGRYASRLPTPEQDQPDLVSLQLLRSKVQICVIGQRGESDKCLVRGASAELAHGECHKYKVWPWLELGLGLHWTREGRRHADHRRESGGDSN